jgi:hypothetical protein
MLEGLLKMHVFIGKETCRIDVVISAVLLRLFKGHLYVLFFIESVMLSKWVKAGMLMQEPIHLLKMLIAEVT